MFKINSWYPILAFYETKEVVLYPGTIILTFHIVTSVPQCFVALESNI